MYYLILFFLIAILKEEGSMKQDEFESLEKTIPFIAYFHQQITNTFSICSQYLQFIKTLTGILITQ